MSLLVAGLWSSAGIGANVAKNVGKSKNLLRQLMTIDEYYSH